MHDNVYKVFKSEKSNMHKKISCGRSAKDLGIGFLFKTKVFPIDADKLLLWIEEIIINPII